MWSRLPLRVALGICGAVALSSAGAVSDAASSSPQSLLVAAYGPAPRVAGGMSVRGGSQGDDVTIASDPRSGDYLVSDPAGLALDGPFCALDSATVARCQNLGPGILVALHAGDNRIAAARNLSARKLTYVGGNDSDNVQIRFAGRTVVFPQVGADIVRGGPGDDLINDNGGADRFFGGGGHDFIRGGPGRDELSGGSGPDRLHADDDDHDALIDCGGDEGDRAIVDRDLDPAPIGCGRVHGPHSEP
jgi:Ca2+-binding RTX toxin-like protein